MAVIAPATVEAATATPTVKTTATPGLRCGAIVLKLRTGSLLGAGLGGTLKLLPGLLGWLRCGRLGRAATVEVSALRPIEAAIRPVKAAGTIEIPSVLPVKATGAIVAGRLTGLRRLRRLRRLKR